MSPCYSGQSLVANNNYYKSLYKLVEGQPEVEQSEAAAEGGRAQQMCAWEQAQLSLSLSAHSHTRVRELVQHRTLLAAVTDCRDAPCVLCRVEKVQLKQYTYLIADGILKSINLIHMMLQHQMESLIRVCKQNRCGKNKIVPIVVQFHIYLREHLTCKPCLGLRLRSCGDRVRAHIRPSINASIFFSYVHQ